jgi:hypothetical protein
MSLSGRWMVVGRYVPFRYGFGVRQLCAFQVGGWLKAVICLYVWG